ncbi:MAG TPA: MFS transporter [Bryobacteraceae bacterium]|nr:MFS transporter [Bryobacteraceae bacterium]
MFHPTMSRIRWWILALLFFATTINYLDRIVFSVLIPEIRKDLHLNDREYGYVQASFQFAYTVGFLVMGKFIDRYGTRIGYAAAIAWWSLAAILHAASRTGLQLATWRAFLGLGEAGNFPAAIKGVAEWFPRRDRAFATGIFNAGSNVASMIGPPLFAYMVTNLGLDWRTCFLVTGGSGFLWLAAWLPLQKQPDKHPGVNAAELTYIQSDGPENEGKGSIGWLQALRLKQTWGFAAGKFLTDPVWWFYLYWLPPYLYDVRKFDLKAIGWALPVVYLMADIGIIGGGWLSGYWIRKGWDHAKARYTTMLLCALAMPIASLSVLVQNPIVAVALVSLATSAHQGLSANLYTTVSDVFPKRAVASVMGIGGCAGGLGGVLFSALIPGIVVQAFGYTPMILTMGVFHLLAVFLVHKLMGPLRPVLIHS